MTEITRVPLQPLAKGSKSKLWLGAIVAIALGGGVAAAVRPPLVDVQTLKAGSGGSPTPADVVLINYIGRLPNGNVFDQQKNVPMMMQGMIPGFVKALQQTQAGGKYLVHIPAKMAYGDHANGPIPANSDLTFEIEVLQFANRAMLEQQQRMMEQMMRQQMGSKGAAGAAPAADGAAPTEAAPE